MVKKSKKSKSKRTTLKNKYKVIRKVKEHHRKKAKEAKKAGLHRKSKVEKDPGIPNDWPFKEQELKALEDRRNRALEELEQKKAARKERAKKRKLGLLEDDDLSKLADMASAKEQKYVSENIEDSRITVVGKNHDNSDRAFYKELVKVIEASDVILEVLDARDPLGTRCIDMENMVMRSGPDKRLILLLNKIDLVPREAVEKWLKYLREEFPAVAFKCNTQEQKSNLSWKSSKSKKKTVNQFQTSDCLGAETLLSLLKNYSRSHEIKKSITVGIIGLPNVGKSSLINSLKRSHVVNVGSTPGLTRSMQEVHLDKNVKLLDCPGVVMLRSSENDASIALRNCKRIEKLDDPIGPVKEILKRCPATSLVTLYKIPDFNTADDFLCQVATVRGRLKKGGIVDIDAAARIVLHDWNVGKIPYFTMPPQRNDVEHSEVRIVSEFGKEFNVDEVYGKESSFIGSLKSVNELNLVEVPSNCPVNFDENMLEDKPQPPPPPRTEDEKGEDEAMGLEKEGEEEKGGAKSDNRKQNEKLYDVEGMLNPKLRRAEKKRRKKDKNSAEMDCNDYDFKVDYVKSDSAMDDVSENVVAADYIGSTNRFELPSGVTLENE
ncbi:unnamed protein product [Cuscuta campestris]|uniref:CP-type G domain-containing protein n=1 Tax=Cuscuta campestris TaxID=132261 RepID=A0A484KUQ3_9ASTE|nr:unnamed protein product [Cuscuta campestris]